MIIAQHKLEEALKTRQLRTGQAKKVKTCQKGRHFGQSRWKKSKHCQKASELRTE
ncbi:hypothetical protein [Neobacillus drentensis]|uniref:hypothetical protein n=1 Tax=Neobacillus drentensis TaxID=220684 RepID=UPI002FFEFC34